MPNSLRCKLRKLRFQEKITEEEYNWLINKLDKHNKILEEMYKPKWIPCSERLPEEYNHVLCQFTLGGMGECYLAHGVFHVVGGLVMTCNEVIAWQPLPQRYEAESEDKE